PFDEAMIVKASSKLHVWRSRGVLRNPFVCSIADRGSQAATIEHVCGSEPGRFTSRLRGACARCTGRDHVRCWNILAIVDFLRGFRSHLNARTEATLRFSEGRLSKHMKRKWHHRWSMDHFSFPLLSPHAKTARQMQSNARA